jgi:hypothetical protein
MSVTSVVVHWTLPPPINAIFIQPPPPQIASIWSHLAAPR